jgi:hypothetical protein
MEECIVILAFLDTFFLDLVWNERVSEEKYRKNQGTQNLNGEISTFML